MNSHKLSDEQITDSIRSMLDSRTDLARTAAVTFRDLQEARAVFEEAQRSYADAFNAAIKGGWKIKELTTQLGLATPETKPRRRLTTKKNTTPKEISDS